MYPISRIGTGSRTSVDTPDLKVGAGSRELMPKRHRTLGRRWGAMIVRSTSRIRTSACVPPATGRRRECGRHTAVDRAASAAGLRLLGSAGIALLLLAVSCAERRPGPRVETEMRLFALRGAMGDWFVEYGFIQTNTVLLAQPDSHGRAYLDGKDFDGGDWASGPLDGWGRRIRISVVSPGSVVELRSPGSDGKLDASPGGDDIVDTFCLSSKGAQPLSVRRDPGAGP